MNPTPIRLVAAALLSLAGMLGALPANAQPAEADPPDRVARLGEVTGRVWLRDDDASGEWIGVGRNRPVTTGDRIASDAGARAELALGSTTLRLDAGTEIEIELLDDTTFRVRLHRGSVAVRLRNDPAVAEFALVTEEGSFRAETVGRYRFDRLEQASELTVLAGQAVFEGQASALHVGTGQHAQFWLDAAGTPQYGMVAPARDAFAAWVDERDRADDRMATNRYVSPEMTGAADLDRYGRWEQSADYGPLWTPSVVAAGWAPYSTGHWAWVRPWGWTWVDDAPWGFAPFHYGRWVRHRNTWCWAPGTYVARPVYAPALVAWIGGPRVGVSINVGGRGAPVGWFPLGPREVYVPSHRSSARYVRNVNFTHVADAAGIAAIVENRQGIADRREFVNRRFANAVTIVPAGVLGGRQAVGPVAARYRQDPGVRQLVNDARVGSVLVAAPVAAPARLAGPREGRPAALPAPFERRGFGIDAARGEGRPDYRRRDGRRFDAAAPVGPAQRPIAVGPEPTTAAPAARSFADRDTRFLRDERPANVDRRPGAMRPPSVLPPPSALPPPTPLAAPMVLPPPTPMPPLRPEPVGIAAPPLAAVPRLERAPVPESLQGQRMQRPPTPERARALDERREGGRERPDRARP